MLSAQDLLSAPIEAVPGAVGVAEPDSYPLSPYHPSQLRLKGFSFSGLTILGHTWGSELFPN